MSMAFCEFEPNRDEVLVAYCYGDIEGDERAVFECHLAGCATCRRELEALRVVRAQLATWVPPAVPSGIQHVLGAARPAMQHGQVSAEATTRHAQRASWSEMPVWVQLAAAMLFLGIAAGAANLDVTYNSAGLRVRTGWLASRDGAAGSTGVSPLADKESASVANPAASSHTPIQQTAEVSPPAESSSHPQTRVQPSAPSRMSDEEVIRRVRAMLRDSEQRQQRELALRVGEVVRDVQAQRQADLVRIDRTLGVLQNSTGMAVRRQEQLLNNLAVRVSQRP